MLFVAQMPKSFSQRCTCANIFVRGSLHPSAFCKSFLMPISVWRHFCVRFLYFYAASLESLCCSDWSWAWPGWWQSPSKQIWPWLARQVLDGYFWFFCLQRKTFLSNASINKDMSDFYANAARTFVKSCFVTMSRLLILRHVCADSVNPHVSYMKPSQLQVSLLYCSGLYSLCWTIWSTLLLYSIDCIVECKTFRKREGNSSGMPSLLAVCILMEDVEWKAIFCTGKT